MFPEKAKNDSGSGELERDGKKDFCKYLGVRILSPHVRGLERGYKVFLAIQSVRADGRGMHVLLACCINHAFYFLCFMMH